MKQTPTLSNASFVSLDTSRCARTIALVVATAVLFCAGQGLAQESKITMTVLGFTKKAKHMLVKMDDNQVGLGVRLYDVETGMPAKPWRKYPLIQYERGDQVKVIKRARRKYKIVDPGIESLKTEDETIAFFGVEKGENLVIAATDYKRLGKVTDVALKRDPETKKMAQGTLKSIFWSSNRKTMVLVVNQKIKGQFLFEKDYFHSLLFKKKKIQWIEAEEKEDDSWWPF